jgi:RHS repeat-associated protein
MGTTTFVWDPVFDCVTHELDENNAVKAVYHNEPQQYGGVLSQRRGNTSHYHHHDALGSTRFLTDSSGSVTDTYLNDAWGNSVTSTGTTVNPFKWMGKYGYYTDDSTGQVYVRARMYQPTVARWRSVDPMFLHPIAWGYQYAANSPASYNDPSGLWIKRSRAIYESEGGEDSLQSLATLVTGNYRDWVCIWPIGDEATWSASSYPVANACARADVSNLLEKDGPTLYQIAPKVVTEPNFLISLRKLFPNAKTWTNGLDAAELFKKTSGQGKTPLGRLGILGHCYRDNAICADGGVFPYTADDVFKVADEKNNSSNTFMHAAQKIGPPRCWLTRNASVYGAACNTEDAWAPDWSEKIARVGVTVFGTPTLLYGETNVSGKSASIQFFERSERYFNARDFLSSPHWLTFAGSQ